MRSPEVLSELKKKWRAVPHCPGVYLMRNEQGAIIYVGKARDLKKRLNSYFNPTRQTLDDPRRRALINSICDFDYYESKSEHTALVLEQKLIREYNPHYNVQFRDDKRYPLIKINLGASIPRFDVARLKKNDSARYFGPYTQQGAMHASMDWISRYFGLRTCSVRSPNADTYKHCHADIIRNCSAPCIGKVSQSEYAERVQMACDLLEGRGKKEILATLQEEMQQAATAQDFERALALRDISTNLCSMLTNTGTQSPRMASLPSTINHEQDLADLGEALDMAPPQIIECFDISNISSTHIVASMVRFTQGRPNPAAYRLYRIRSVSTQNDFASMAEVIRRRYTRIISSNAASKECPAGTPKYKWLKHLAARGESPITVPDLVIVDGGKGQLSQALEELTAIGLEDMPLIGLAKREEEIFFPHQATPLVIDHSAGALKLIQRIRDEAHRKANGYNALLMKKRMRESILDDCLGMGPKRKMTLLSHFKDIEAIRCATAQEIATLPGISLKWAQGLLQYLSA